MSSRVREEGVLDKDLQRERNTLEVDYPQKENVE